VPLVLEVSRLQREKQVPREEEGTDENAKGIHAVSPSKDSRADSSNPGSHRDRVSENADDVKLRVTQAKSILASRRCWRCGEIGHDRTCCPFPYRRVSDLHRSEVVIVAALEIIADPFGPFAEVEIM
jgi:hypothetical protein